MEAASRTATLGTHRLAGPVGGKLEEAGDRGRLRISSPAGDSGIALRAAKSRGRLRHIACALSISVHARHVTRKNGWHWRGWAGIDREEAG